MRAGGAGGIYVLQCNTILGADGRPHSAGRTAPDAADCALDARPGGAAPPDGRPADLGGRLPGRYGPGARARHASTWTAAAWPDGR